MGLAPQPLRRLCEAEVRCLSHFIIPLCLHDYLGPRKWDWLRNRSAGFAKRRFGACPTLLSHFARTIALGEENGTGSATAAQALRSGGSVPVPLCLDRKSPISWGDEEQTALNSPRTALV
jgi:hypothetical protein